MSYGSQRAPERDIYIIEIETTEADRTADKDSRTIFHQSFEDVEEATQYAKRIVTESVLVTFTEAGGVYRIGARKETTVRKLRYLPSSTPGTDRT